jgi:tetratricopeptide (TPR) repeat protein
MNQYQKAIEIWEQYLLYDDKNVTVLTRIADSYRKVKKFTNTKNAYHRVLEIEESNAYAIIGLGHLYYDFKDYKEALFYLEKMLEFGFDKADIRVLTSVGNCHRKLKTFSEGIPFFEAALRRENNNFYALFGLVDCYRGMNCTENVIEYCNRILEIDPKNKMILTRIGDAYRNLKEFYMAKKYYERALNIEFDTYAIMGIALISKAQEKYDEAIFSLRRLIQLDNRNYRIYAELSDCYLKNGEYNKAVEILEDFKKIGTKNKK